MSFYIKPADVKNIRSEIRERFPLVDGWKWSVTTMDNNVGITVALLQYPRGYAFPTNKVIDHHNPANDCGFNTIDAKETKVMVDACEIMLAGVEDEQSCYFQLSIGTWQYDAEQQK